MARIQALAARFLAGVCGSASDRFLWLVLILAFHGQPRASGGHVSRA